MDVVIICVPTPLNEYHEPDLSYITGTVRAIAPHLNEGQLIILESTTYPGTTEEIVVPLLEQGNLSGLRVARDASAQDSMSRSLPSAKIRATTRLRGAIFPRWWAAADRLRVNWHAPFTLPSSTAPCRFLRPPLRR